MLAATLLALLTATPQLPGVHETAWSGAELLGMAESLDGSRATLKDGVLRLDAGARLRAELPLEQPARSVGLLLDGRAAAFRVAWESDGSFFPLREAHDLAATAPDARGAAGDHWVSGLFHSYTGERGRVVLECSGPAEIAGLRLVGIAASANAAAPTAPQPPPGSGRSYPKPPVEPRSAWGADPPACGFGSCTVTHLAVHHSAGANEYLSPGYAQCAANVKAIQSYHIYTRGWCDIGYQYLVCVHGRLWEGRPGDDVVGAHDARNCGSMALCFLGYFHAPYDQQPLPAMLDAAAELFAWKASQRGIDPLGSSWYAGLGGVMANLYGHRDVGTTACPGDLLYAELPGLRQGVAARLSGGGWSLVLDNPAAHFTGSWSTGTSSGDKYGADYRWASTGTAPAQAWWTPALPQAGRYEIALWWPAGSNRSAATQVGLRANGQWLTGTVDQRVAGGRWNVLGTVWLPAGSSTPIGLSNAGPAGSVVVADALRLVRR